MRARRIDFVNVQLTAAGVKQVGAEGSVAFSNRHMHYTFKPGAVQEVVLKYEWLGVLRHERTFAGEPMFELVDAPVADTDSEPDQELVNLTEDEVTSNGSV